MPAGSDPNCPGRRLTTSMWGSRFADSLGRPVPRPRIPAAWGPLHHPPRGAHHPQRLCRHVGVHLRAHQLQRASNGVRRAGQRHGLCLAGEWWALVAHCLARTTQRHTSPLAAPIRIRRTIIHASMQVALSCAEMSSAARVVVANVRCKMWCVGTCLGHPRIPSPSAFGDPPPPPALHWS